LIFPILIYTQEADDCDLVQIECCNFSVNHDTLTIYASNRSSNIFSYPGFILLDDNMDTVAIETVNYYGIGVYPQPHKLEIVGPLILPFEGFLELHTLFFEEYACTFPLSIPDTLTVGTRENLSDVNFLVSPNPANDFIQLSADKQHTYDAFSLKIINFTGQELLFHELKHFDATIQVSHLKPGIYSLLILNKYNQLILTEKLIIQ